MGFARRVVRKSVRKATPRPVRRAMHPVGTLKSAVTPRPLKQLNRAVYTVTNPLGAAENAVIGAALYPRRGARRTSARRTPSSSTGTVSGTGIRAQEAVQVHDRLTLLMAVQRERFASSARPIVPIPQRQDAGPVAKADWRRRRREVRPWRRSARKELHQDVQQQAQEQVELAYQSACHEAEAAQAEADAWWRALTIGDGPVTTAALQAAFADNTAPVAVTWAQGSHAMLVLSVPPLSVIPAKKAHVTPSGRLSSKAWTKTELNGVYVSLIGSHLLGTLREAFAVAPSLESVRVIGVRFDAGAGQSILFDVSAGRTDIGGDDEVGVALLAGSPQGLRKKGRSGEVQAWPREDLDPSAIKAALS
jgi:hypothetical protein